MIAAAAVLVCPAATQAPGLKFCIVTDKPIGSVLVTGAASGVSRDWYMRRAANAFCNARSEHDCRAEDFQEARCGLLPSATLSFVVGDAQASLASQNQPANTPRLRGSLR